MRLSKRSNKFMYRINLSLLNKSKEVDKIGKIFYFFNEILGMNEKKKHVSSNKQDQIFNT